MTKEELKKRLQRDLEYLKKLARVNNLSQEWLNRHIAETTARYERWMKEAI